MSYSCAEWRGDIGAYIVGALDGRARARVGRHLVACPGCRADYDDLVPVRAWLGRLALAGRHPDTGPAEPPGRPPHASVSADLLRDPGLDAAQGPRPHSGAGWSPASAPSPKRLRAIRPRATRPRATRLRATRLQATWLRATRRRPRATRPWATRLRATRPRATRLRATRPRHRRSLLAAVAAAAAAAAFLAALVISGPSAPSYRAVDSATGVSGHAQLHATPAGTEIDLTATGLPPGKRCILVAVAPGGADIAGTWDATYDGSARIAGTSAFPPSRLTALRIESDTGILLLSIRVRRR
jgi:hypothetical protein